MNRPSFYYVYTLSFNHVVFYVGFTNNPRTRFQQHMHGYCGTPSYEHIYWQAISGVLPEMTIIHHYMEAEAARIGEATLIDYFVSIYHPLCNRHPNPTWNRVITCTPYPNDKRLKLKKGYSNCIYDILKYYHEKYDINYRHKHLGDPAGPGSGIRSNSPMYP